MFSNGKFDRRSFMKATAGLAGSLVLTREAFAQAANYDEVLPVNIISTAGDSATTFVELLKTQGFLDKYGLDANFVTVSDGSMIVTALLSGEADIARSSGINQTLAAIQRGAELRVVGGASLPLFLALYSANPDVRTLKDLEGRTVGTGAPGTLLHHITWALLRKNDVDVDRVTFVNIGSSSSVFRAVMAGTVDAGPGQNSVHDEQERYGIHSISEFWTDLPEYPYQAASASTTAIEQKRENLIRSLAAFKEVYDFVQRDDTHDVYVETYMRATGETDPSRPSTQWRFFNEHKPFNIILPEDRIDYLQQLNMEAGIQRQMTPIDQIVDYSMAREAIERTQA